MGANNYILDAHQHFWQLSRGDYHWLTPDLTTIHRDFMPEDFQPTLEQFNVAGTILVQAATTLAETEFLLNIADNHDFVLGVVGWADMMSENFSSNLTKLAARKYFCGLRPMIQDIADINWMLDKKLIRPFTILEELQLSFDALIQPQHLKNLMRLIEQYPDLKVVIDHMAKPKICDNGFKHWAEDIAIIAENSNAYCKLSGLITEVGENWTPDMLMPYIDHIFHCFGPKRIMWGSDWPLITMFTDYRRWLELCRQYVLRNCPDTAITDVFCNVAANFYELSPEMVSKAAAQTTMGK